METPDEIRPAFSLFITLDVRLAVNGPVGCGKG